MPIGQSDGSNSFLEILSFPCDSGFVKLTETKARAHTQRERGGEGEGEGKGEGEGEREGERERERERGRGRGRGRGREGEGERVCEYVQLEQRLLWPAGYLLFLWAAALEWPSVSDWRFTN
jgi:hypothetical protein